MILGNNKTNFIASVLEGNMSYFISLGVYINTTFG